MMLLHVYLRKASFKDAILKDLDLCGTELQGGKEVALKALAGPEEKHAEATQATWQEHV